MEKEIAIADLIKMDFDEAFNKDNCWGFFDWFCKDSSLKNKAKVLFGKVKALARSGKFDPTKTYVFFKNNCPLVGNHVTPKSGHSGKAEVWGEENDFEYPIVSGTWREVRMWFFN